MVTIVDEHRRGIALGAAGYLTKPIDRERLHLLVSRFGASIPPTCVLLVEDDANQRERVRSWLAGTQWAVREAANGREALVRLRDGKPEVILLDLMLPEMDGFAVVVALQKGGLVAGHSDHSRYRTRSRRQRPRVIELGGRIGTGQGDVPTGRSGRDHPTASAG
jgi:CheY-like chemotaxis protein